MPEISAHIWIDAEPDRVWAAVSVRPAQTDPVGQKAQVTFDRSEGWHAVQTPELTVISDVEPADGGTRLTLTWQYHVAPRLLPNLLHLFTRRFYRSELTRVLVAMKEEIEAETDRG